MSAAQKYTIAREVSRLGCHVIDLCFPTVAVSEREVLRLAYEGKRNGELRDDLEILVMCRASRRDIDATVEIIEASGFSAGDITFLIFTSASGLHVKYKLGETLLRRERVDVREGLDLPVEFFHEANKRMVAEAIGYAQERGVSRVEFGTEDASRTPLESLLDLVRTAVEGGAFRYVFPDTTGSLTPESTRLYCSALTAAFPQIERVSHFHDDFGLATANTITAALHGFTTMTTTLNGLGERAGNAPLHAVVAALRYLYGLEIPGFRYDLLGAVKNTVERITGIPVEAKEPVIGRNVFAHESGIHAHGVEIHRSMYEPIPFQEVGGEGRFVYGKHSGSGCVASLLSRRQDELGREVDRELVLAVLARIKALRESRISSRETERVIEEYYANLDRLGVHEDEVVRIARSILEVERRQDEVA